LCASDLYPVRSLHSEDQSPVRLIRCERFPWARCPGSRSTAGQPRCWHLSSPQRAMVLPGEAALAGQVRVPCDGVVEIHVADDQAAPAAWTTFWNGLLAPGIPVGAAEVGADERVRAACPDGSRLGRQGAREGNPRRKPEQEAHTDAAVIIVAGGQTPGLGAAGAGLRLRAGAYVSCSPPPRCGCGTEALALVGASFMSPNFLPARLRAPPASVG